MAKKRIVLITGATGKQGRATISALLCSSPATSSSSEDADVEYDIWALSRNISAPPAKAILREKEAHPGRISLVQGDMDDPASIRKIFEDAVPHGGLWGVLVVLQYPGLGAKTTNEPLQGKVPSDCQCGGSLYGPLIAFPAVGRSCARV